MFEHFDNSLVRCLSLLSFYIFQGKTRQVFWAVLYKIPYLSCRRIIHTGRPIRSPTRPTSLFASLIGKPLIRPSDLHLEVFLHSKELPVFLKKFLCFLSYFLSIMSLELFFLVCLFEICSLASSHPHLLSYVFSKSDQFFCDLQYVFFCQNLNSVSSSVSLLLPSS